MIKLIIFDLDGVLVDAKELHYEALNKALENIGSEYVIGKEEHLAKYDGLSTSRKLDLLTKEKGLPEKEHGPIWLLKQKTTIHLIKQFVPDYRLINVLSELKRDRHIIAVASNSIRETVKFMLLRKGFMEHIDFFLSNQDVKNPKPNPEIYLQCMIKAGASPKETLIIEDSHIGRKAAADSGAQLLGVRDSKDVTYDKISTVIELSKDASIIPKWQGEKMNVLIPMAGEGSRFASAGYSFPKPLIAVKNMNDKPMIQVVVDNLNIDARHVFIVLAKHSDQYNVPQMLSVISPGCKVILQPHKFDGAVCSTLLAKDDINNDEPLIIANSDQFMEWNSNEFMYSMINDSIDGGILTFKNSHPKWSYAKVGPDGFVTEVREKQVISDDATVGVYYWKKGSDYVKYAEQMIAKDIRFNNEFYVAPVYNEAIVDGKKIKIFHIDKIWGLGTPEDLTYFQDHYKT